MARQKVSKKFYEPKDVKYRFRWTFLDVLRKEYEAKVIKLEEVLPLYQVVSTYPSQYLHKNRYQDLKILEHPDSVSLGSWCSAVARENRRERTRLDEMRRFAARMQKRLERYDH